jgi:hypothetical protein
MKNYKYHNYEYDSLNPNRALSRRAYYERELSPVIASLEKIIRSRDDALCINTPVVFRGIAFGEHPETIYRKLGKPRYVIEKYMYSSPVFFYKEKINHCLVVTQLHFLENQFFCGCHTFHYENDAQRQHIENLFFEKYGVQNRRDNDKKYFHLADKNKNSITLFDTLVLNILYMWGDDEKIRKGIYSHTRSEYLHKAMEKQKEENKLLRIL